jgi:hypothetical protein
VNTSDGASDIFDHMAPDHREDDGRSRIPMSKEKRMIRAIEAAGLTWWLMFNFVLFLLLNRPRSRRWTAPSFGRQSHHRVMKMSGDCHRALCALLSPFLPSIEGVLDQHIHLREALMQKS